MSDHTHVSTRGFHGPRCWILSALVGICLGLVWGWLMPAKPAAAADAHAGSRVKEITPAGDAFERLASGQTRPWSDPPSPSPAPAPSPAPSSPPHSEQSAEGADTGHHTPPISLVLTIPFVVLLASIAMMPFVNVRFWHRHYPDFAFALGGLTAGYYLMSLGDYGRHALLHALIEYYSFIALIGGLFVVSGGILIRVNVRATPFANTLLLAFGAVIANLVGTTGASMLLIRPFMHMNAGRLRPIHIVMFIFIVSNCGGCLTPIGDPPLYLGYLKGVPFLWTFTNLWPMWAWCVGLLLAIFLAIDSRIQRRTGDDVPAVTSAAGSKLPIVSIRGSSAFVCLALMVAGVFIDPLLKKTAGIEGIPIGATFQIIVACIAYKLANKQIHQDNDFNFHPVKEVGLLFAGIFLTMIPALGYLESNAGKLGLETPSQFYFLTGGLSALLDNAPTYLTFTQAALGVLHLPLNGEGIARFIANEYQVVHADGSFVHFQGTALLQAISLGAVFFGAMTYIGNGPNFMVKSIAEGKGASQVRMPSFFGYLGYACVILLPVLAAVWAVFVR